MTTTTTTTEENTARVLCFGGNLNEGFASGGQEGPFRGDFCSAPPPLRGEVRRN